MASLRQLQAFFLKYHEEKVDPTVWIDGVMHTSGIKKTFERVETLSEADGIWFRCPLCEPTANPHSIRIGFRGKAVPGTYGYNKDGQPVLWDVIGGTGLDDLQLSPSIQIQGGCNWHGFVGSSGILPGYAGGGGC